ncbi:MAG: sugar ABC transporter ATP-binding protein [Geminicoccaceae bacterium]
MTPVLEVRNINKLFPGVRALNDVQLDVLPGEVHALLGENGAGKSTLIKIISGVYQPDGGSVRIQGTEVNFQSPLEAQSAGIAAIYQELLLFPALTVAENIYMGHPPRNRFGGVDWQTMRRNASDILGSLDIHDLDPSRVVGTLSIGNRQRVEIAKALSRDAHLLIMDEPTAALTEADVERLFEIVRKLCERDVGVIYISHRLEEVFELADRVTVLRDGGYVGTKLVTETSRDDLISMMVGRTIDSLFPKKQVDLGGVVLRVENLHRPPLTKNVSLTIKSGEIVGLAGLVGSGRSELAQAIFGVTLAYSGEVYLAGEKINIRSPRDAKALGIAYVPEDRGIQGLIRPMTLRENISLAVLERLVSGMTINREDERALAENAIVQFGIRASSDEQVVDKLSGGNQQKAVLAKWLATNPRILIMDEPTRGVDVGAKAEIHRLMGELVEQGLAILMISSELPEILGMSDRILVMREGEIVAAFDRDEADQEEIAGAMMGIRHQSRAPVDLTSTAGS